MGAQITRPRRHLVFCPHIQSNRPRTLVSPNDSPSGKAVTRSVRAAALRSTALATSLAFVAVGLSVATEAWAKPKVPLPKPRPIARNVVPKTTPRRRPRPMPRRQPTPSPRRRRHLPPAAPHALAPATRQHAAVAAGPQAGGAGRDGRDVLDLAGRQARRWKTSSSWSASASPTTPRRLAAAISDPVAQKARRMADPAQRQQRRHRRALSRLHRRQSELAVADLPAPPRSRRRCGTTSATTPRCGRGSRTSRRSRPRADSRWRRR